MVGPFRGGTEQYFSPEKAASVYRSARCHVRERCNIVDGPASDVYALGILLFMIIARGYPFKDMCHPSLSSAQATSLHEDKVHQRYRSRLHALDREAAHLIDSMLAARPEERPTVQQVLTHPFLRPSRLHG